jgi:hypothetical protein
MGWEDDKDLGPEPWNFTEQPDKWGYLNNPRWQPVPSAPVNYSGNEGAEPQIWTPWAGKYNDGGSDIHNPCGHWHKGVSLPRFTDFSNQSITQQTIDVHHGRIALTGMMGDTPDGGFICCERVGGTWYVLGVIGNTSQYLEPNTLRISSNDGYIAYYASVYPYVDPSGNFPNYLGIYRFDRGDLPRKVTAWENNWSTGIPYKASDYKIYNIMDCYGSLLSCAGYILQVNGVNYNKYQIKTSTDSAMSFGTTFEFPSGFTTNAGAPYYQDHVQIRITQDGTIWASYLRSALGTTMIELWKSTNSGSNFSKIWEKDFYSDLGNAYALGMLFDVEEEAGERLSIRLNGATGGNYNQVVYYSTNYGVSFNTYTDVYALADVPYYSRGTANGPTINHGDNTDTRFLRSTDGGNIWSNISMAGRGMTGNYVDQQKHHDEIVYTECGSAFDGPDANLISFFRSVDGGASWLTEQSPYEISADGRDNIIPYYPGYTEIPNLDVSGRTGTVTINNVITGGAVTWSTAPDLFNDPNRDIRWVRIA